MSDPNNQEALNSDNAPNEVEESRVIRHATIRADQPEKEPDKPMTETEQREKLLRQEEMLKREAKNDLSAVE